MAERILVVDDEESIRFTFEAFLLDAGYQVVTAASFEAGLQSVAAAEFDLVFLDIMLGRASGLELLQAIREQQANCPVVMITGAPEVDTAAEAVRRGAFDYIPKPVRQDTLMRVTKMALHHREVVEQREKFRAHLEAIFRSVRDGLLLVDAQLNILEVNQALLEMFGLPAQVKTMNLAQLPENLRSVFCTFARRELAAAGPVAGERLELLDPSGRSRVFALTASTWTDPGGRPLGVVLTVRDETRLEDLERSLKQRRQFEHIIGCSAKIQAVYDLIENLAEVDTTVLVTGESGTGKELVAEALHYRSPRCDGPLVKVNCAALPENLLESELFGHLKGSFTGALKDKVGRFQMAHGGTLFLDEIGDISPALQVRLLRVLQNKEIEKVGSNSPIQVDVRIVAATNRNLQERVKAGEFREDLFYRLRVIEIGLPPLRERREDIALLVDHFVGRFNARFGRSIQGVSAPALALLTAYAWPGNIRELENAMERAFVLCREPVITPQHLPPEVQAMPGASLVATASPPPDGDEAEELLGALAKSGGNKSRAARLLGISRRTIYRKLEEHGISLPDDAE